MSSSRKDKKSSKVSGWTVLAAVVGAGIGYAAHKIIEAFTQQEKVQSKSQPNQQSKIQVTKTTIDNYDDLQELMVCPITQEIMSQPYILTPCGHSFQKSFIQGWVQKSGCCPLCKAKVTQADLKSNYHLKQLIHYYQYNKNVTKKGPSIKQKSQQKPQREPQFQKN